MKKKEREKTKKENKKAKKKRRKKKEEGKKLKKNLRTNLLKLLQITRIMTGFDSFFHKFDNDSLQLK